MKQIGKGKNEKDQSNSDCFIVDHLGTHKLVCEVHLQDMAFRYLVMDIWNAILDGCAIDCNEDFEKFLSECSCDDDLKYAKAVCDHVKDQTYFLSHLSQNQLKRLLFPLGCIPKVSLMFQTSGCIPRSSSSTVDCDFSNIFLLSTLYSLNNHLQDEFRKLAVKFNLPNKDIKESQGICILYKTCQLVLKFSDGYTFLEQVFYFLILPDSQRKGL
uniref:Uncharacterized protein n=1 Tax=Cucumis melo TaxID=3656 RepID=A0A9I9EEL3_CUCME